MTFTYFAYGSNMLSSRLIARCPSAKVMGSACVHGFALEFSKKSIDSSGKATMVTTADAIFTQGVLFEINVDEREELDKFESVGIGNGYGYICVNDFYVEAAGKAVNVTTYLASVRHEDLLPYDWYLALVIAGAQEHGLDENYLEFLRATKYVVDANLGRASRIAACRALNDHGLSDYKALLKK